MLAMPGPSGLNGGVGGAEEAGLAGIGPGPVLRRRGQADERRHRRIDRALQLRLTTAPMLGRPPIGRKRIRGQPVMHWTASWPLRGSRRRSE